MLRHNADIVISMKKNNINTILEKSHIMYSVWMRSSIVGIFGFTWNIFYYHNLETLKNDVSGWFCPYIIMDRGLSKELDTSSNLLHKVTALPELRKTISEIKTDK